VFPSQHGGRYLPLFEFKRRENAVSVWWMRVKAALAASADAAAVPQLATDGSLKWRGPDAELAEVAWR
jgi:hypothetical protein